MPCDVCNARPCMLRDGHDNPNGRRFSSFRCSLEQRGVDCTKHVPERPKFKVDLTVQSDISDDPIEDADEPEDPLSEDQIEEAESDTESIDSRVTRLACWSISGPEGFIYAEKKARIELHAARSTVRPWSSRCLHQSLI